MQCTFQVGDRVVCVDAYATNVWGDTELVEGAVYTIREVTCDRGEPAGLNKYSSSAGTWVRLKEINPRKHHNNCDLPFAAARFRPVKPLSFWIGEKQKVRA